MAKRKPALRKSPKARKGTPQPKWAAAKAARQDGSAALRRQLADAREQQRATAEVLRVISGATFNLPAVLETLLEAATRLCEAADTIIFLKRGDLVVTAAHFGPIPVDFPEQPLGRGWVSGRAIVDKSLLHVRDVRTVAGEYPDAKLMSDRLGFRTVLAVPLMKGDEAIGTITMRRVEVRSFTRRQIELVKTFADQAVIAIENVRLFEEVKARTEELHESLQQQTATADVLKLISRSAFDLPNVLTALLESAARLCEADFGNVARPSRDGWFLVEASYGTSPEFAAAIRRTPMRSGRASAMGRALEEKATVHILDAAADPDYELAATVGIDGFRTLLGVPLMREGTPIGVFAVGRRTVRAFTNKQIQLITTFADQAAIAIENVRLFNETKEALERQTATAEILRVISSSPTDTQPVFNAIVQSGLRLFPDSTIGIALPDGDQVKAVAVAEPDPVRAEAWRDRFPFPLTREYMHSVAILDAREVDVPDVADAPASMAAGASNFLGSGYRAVTIMPMLRGSAAIGALSVVRLAPGPLTDNQRAMLKTFADQAVIAIENTRLLNELRQRTNDLSEALDQQTAIGDILRAISNSPGDVTPVFATLAERAARICEATIVDIFTVASDRLLIVETVGELGRPTHEGVPLDRSTVMGRSICDMAPVHVADLQDGEHDFPTGRKLAKQYGHRAILSVPLIREGKALGGILVRRSEARPFEDKHVGLLTTFADQAAIAIENARLVNELRHRTDDLTEALQQQTATADVLKVISRSAFDLQRVLQTLLESAVRLAEADSGTIARQYDGVFYRAEAYGFSKEFLEAAKRLPVKASRDSAASRALLEGRVVQIPDILADPDYTFSETVGFDSFRTALGVPMLREGHPIGVLALTRSEVRPFTEKQIELVSTFADQAAIAIENARLFEEVQARTKELAASLDDLRAAQDRLIQTEKLASLGQLTAGIAHEIKNPLNFVNNFSALSGELIDELHDVLSAAALDDKVREEIDELTHMLKGNLEKVVQHGNRADSIVKNMLLHSRHGSGQQQRADINAIVEESLNLAYHGARAERTGFNITLQRNLDPEAGVIELYPQEITRVFLNLISNGFYAATKRKEAGGENFEPTLSATTRRLGDTVEIRIRDNGAGIPQDMREKIFNPFFTTKPPGEGTGLGLSMSHDIVVKQHGGRIDVDSAPGEFTEFIITLPRTASQIQTGGTR